MTAVAQPGTGNGLPYGEAGVGAKAPPQGPPPPFNALGTDLADLRHELGLVSQAVLQLQDRPAAKPKRQMPASVRQFPKRHVVPIVIAVGTLATVVGISQCSPRLSEEQVAAAARQDTLAAVVPYVDSKIQQVPTVSVMPEPLAVYGLELSENAKTAIGWRRDPQSGAVLGMNTERSEYVAKQVRVLSATHKLLDLRLTSVSPTDLRVTTNIAEGFPLFLAPSVEATAAPTTVTSAP